MSKIEAYREAVVTCALAAKMLLGHDLRGILSAIDRCDALAPITDPTLYLKNSKAMHEDEEIIRAALPLLAIGEKMEAMSR